MGFAGFYFERQKEFQVKLNVPSNNNLKYIVVIPCYYEFDILDTLNSIWNSKRPGFSTEVIVVINSSEGSNEKAVSQNRKTYSEVKSWIKNHDGSLLRFFVLLEENLPRKFAGAGLARKIGMDQALYRFHKVNQERGVIVSLDADATIKENYFVELDRHFNKFPNTNVATIYFEHPLGGNKYNKETYEAITIYELYLRYYKLALKYSGFPYAHYTIGSCFIVNAKAYAKQGGMSRKQAGEDFYLLHKIFPLGQHYEINSTCVYPSPRASERVPFGTGPMVKTLSEAGNKGFLTYNFEAFNRLKILFGTVPGLFRISDENLGAFLQSLPLCLRSFLEDNKVKQALQEINKNSASLTTFIKRFYEWFNAFRILKYLNFVHDGGYFQKQELLDGVEKLLAALEMPSGEAKSYKNYLGQIRNQERGF